MLKQSLKVVEWPSKASAGALDNGTKLVAVRESFRDLLAFESVCDSNLKSNSNHSASPETALSSTFKLLVDPLIVRFAFHFESNRPTNRIDKPEWFLTHVLGLVQDHSKMLTRALQPVLVDVALETKTTPANATHEFLTPILIAVRRKLEAAIETLFSPVVDTNSASSRSSSPRPESPNVNGATQDAMFPLAGHLVREMIQFDRTLDELHGYPVCVYNARFSIPEACLDGPCLSLVTSQHGRLIRWAEIESFCMFVFPNN
jgi:hypothetical protein